jgi:hypothetical protein
MPTTRSGLKGSNSLGVQTRSRAKEVTFEPQPELGSGRKRKQTPASTPRQLRKKSVRQSPREAEKASANKTKQEAEQPAPIAARDEAGPSRRAGRKGPTLRHRVSKPAMTDEEAGDHGDDAGRTAAQVLTALDCPWVLVCLLSM